MTKEQEVIEYFKKQIESCSENADICDDNNFNEEAAYLRKQRYMYKTVLNMLNKYSAESAEKDKIIAEKSAEIEKLKTDFKIVDQECSRLERKEAKQDKMIDLMAEFIENNTLNDVLIENVCLTLKCKNEECHEDNWKECIKQYFERRVEDETI